MSAAPGGDDRTLHGRFLRGLAAWPDRPAFRVGDRAVTYEDAHTTALAWAGALANSAPEPPRAVAVLATRSAEAYTGLLAALYLGATAVPVHPDSPVARNKAVLRAAGVDAVIADERGYATLDALLDGAAIPALAPTAAQVPRGTALSAPLPVRPEDTAYVLFTSGSTGRPKGVPTTHLAADSYFRVLDARYRFEPDDVFSQTFDLTFDCAMFDLFCAWGAGACVTPPPMWAYRALPEYLAEEKVTVWFSTPGAVSVARRAGGLEPGSLSGLRWSLFAGEPLHRRDAEEWQRAAPHSVVENLYGPTELTVTVSAHRLSPGTPRERYVNGVVPIGSVHGTLDHLLLGPDGRVVHGPGRPGNGPDGGPDGAAEGELCVTGPQMFAGYLDPAQDEGRFVDHDGRRWYRTGDRVHRWADGDLSYLGRADEQVQVHGMRVELPEISEILRQADGVDDAVTVAVPVDGSHDLVAFYTGAPGRPVELAKHLAADLPRAMVPRNFQYLEAFPVNANNKIDRTALRARAATLLGHGRTEP